MTTFSKKWSLVSIAVLFMILVPALLVLAFITEVKTLPPSNVTQHEATLNGKITATGGGTILGHFRYTKNTTASCINMQNETNTPDQTLSSVNGQDYTMSYNITGLQSGTTYYYCAIGTQGGISQYGKVESFLTNPSNIGGGGGSGIGGLGIGVSSSSSIAVSIEKQFSGIIINMKAKEIEALEAANFACEVPGTSIEIKSKGKKGYQPTSYIIPTGTVSKTKHAPAAGQQIVGKYNGKTSVTCIYQGYPPVEETVELDTITLYGNSAR